jgi:hypothetical protein
MEYLASYNFSKRNATFFSGRMKYKVIHVFNELIEAIYVIPSFYNGVDHQSIEELDLLNRKNYSATVTTVIVLLD